MNTPQERVSRRRRTREAVQRLVSEFQTSGSRPSEFCRRHGLAPSTLRRNLRKQRVVCRATLFRGNGDGIGTNYFVGIGPGDPA